MTNNQTATTNTTTIQISDFLRKNVQRHAYIKKSIIIILCLVYSFDGSRAPLLFDRKLPQPVKMTECCCVEDDELRRTVRGFISWLVHRGGRNT